MALTDEEKAKIIEEERLRAQARQQFSSAPPKKKSILNRPVSGVGCLVLIILGVILFFAFSSLNDAQDRAQEAAGTNPNTAEEDVAKQEALKKRNEAFAKVQLLNVRIEKNIIDVPELRLTIKNTTGRDIDAVVFETTFSNNFDEGIRDWSGNSTYTGSYQEVIKNGATADISSQLVQWEHATKVKTPKLIRVHFVDGEDVQ
ncbi:MAG: hypothetical protein ABH878_10210 [bacterium]